RIQRGTVRAKEVERRPCFGRVTGRNDAGAGPGRLPAEVALVENPNSDPFAREEIGGRQPDNDAAQDKHVGVICNVVVIGSMEWEEGGGSGWACRTCQLATVTQTAYCGSRVGPVSRSRPNPGHRQASVKAA